MSTRIRLEDQDKEALRNELSGNVVRILYPRRREQYIEMQVADLVIHALENGLLDIDESQVSAYEMMRALGTPRTMKNIVRSYLDTNGTDFDITVGGRLVGNDDMVFYPTTSARRHNRVVPENGVTVIVQGLYFP